MKERLSMQSLQRIWTNSPRKFRFRHQRYANQDFVYFRLLISEQLIRSKRIFTRTSIHTAQKTFLFIPVIGYDDAAGRGVRLNKHLVSILYRLRQQCSNDDQNDFFLFSHFHEIGAGLPNLEGDDGWPTDDQASLSSVVRKPQHIDDHFHTNHRQISEQVSYIYGIDFFYQGSLVNAYLR